eukprot:jgi/Ulvmu1/9014/UM005_0105.1
MVHLMDTSIPSHIPSHHCRVLASEFLPLGSQSTAKVMCSAQLLQEQNPFLHDPERIEAPNGQVEIDMYQRHLYAVSVHRGPCTGLPHWHHAQGCHTGRS